MHVFPFQWNGHFKEKSGGEESVGRDVGGFALLHSYADADNADTRMPIHQTKSTKVCMKFYALVCFELNWQPYLAIKPMLLALIANNEFNPTFFYEIILIVI